MISLLVAMDNTRLIGKNNDLPWHLPADLAYFKRVTMGNKIVMGRKTYESIGHPLPGRENIIITRNTELQVDGCKVIHTPMEILELNSSQEDEIFVIGGAEIFKEILPFADRLYITAIDETFEGDTYFPEVNSKDWSLISKEKGVRDEKNPFDYYYEVYERRTN